MDTNWRIPEQEEAKRRGRHGIPYTTWHRDATLFTPKEQAKLFNGIHGSDAIDYRP